MLSRIYRKRSVTKPFGTILRSKVRKGKYTFRKLPLASLTVTSTHSDASCLRYGEVKEEIARKVSSSPVALPILLSLFYYVVPQAPKYFGSSTAG
jgi:hypothetical protein